MRAWKAFEVFDVITPYGDCVSALDDIDTDLTTNIMIQRDHIEFVGGGVHGTGVEQQHCYVTVASGHAFRVNQGYPSLRDDPWFSAEQGGAFATLVYAELRVPGNETKVFASAPDISCLVAPRYACAVEDAYRGGNEDIDHATVVLMSSGCRIFAPLIRNNVVDTLNTALRITSPGI